jgi:hypothetical protein
MATTTNYGWETPDDTDLVKDGALAQRTTASAIDSTLGTALNSKLHSGLVLIKAQVIGSGVSSVTLTNVFNSTYDNYKVLVSGGVSSTTDGMTVQLGPSSVSGYNTQYYQSLIYASYSGGAVANAAAGNQAVWVSLGYSYGSNGYTMDFDCLGPNLAKYTEVFGHRGGINASANVGPVMGFHNSLGQFTDLKIAINSGTLTGGTVAIYGYAKD